MPTFVVPPTLDSEEVARLLREQKGKMSILEMQRLSGVDRQVLYRLMGGSSINRTPYELVVKLIKFLNKYAVAPQVVTPAVHISEISQVEVTPLPVQSEVVDADLPVLNVSILE